MKKYLFSLRLARAGLGLTLFAYGAASSMEEGASRVARTELQDEIFFDAAALLEEMRREGSATGLLDVLVPEAVEGMHMPLRYARLGQRVVFNGLDEGFLGAILSKMSSSRFSPTGCRAEISALCVDIKLQNNRAQPQNDALKILEFGEMKNGGFNSFDAVFDVGGNWSALWKYLATFKIPIFYVGPVPMEGKFARRRADAAKIAWQDFLEVQGRAFGSFFELETDDGFKNLKTHHVGSPTALADYAGIVVFRRRDDREAACLQQLENFKQKYPNFLVLDRVSRPFAANKYLTDILFRSSRSLSSVRPTCHIYPKSCSSELVQQIIRDVKADHFVIKPVDSGMSNGVIVSSKERLQADLKRIFGRQIQMQYSSHPYSFNYRPPDPVSFAYWVGDTHQYFMVEGYVPSRILQVGGRNYDPTLTVSFVLSYDRGRIGVKLLHAWWKLPPASLDDAVQPTLRHVSQFRPDLDSLPAENLAPSQADKATLRALLPSILAKAYARMLYVYHEMANGYQG